MLIRLHHLYIVAMFIHSAVFSISSNLKQDAIIAQCIKSYTIIFTNISTGRLYPPSPSNLLFHPILRGYYNDGKSRHDTIDVARVVVVVQVAVVVHIHEVGSVAQVGRTLPPVISRHPTARRDQATARTGKNAQIQDIT